MSDAAMKVLVQAMDLPPEDRRAIGERLLDSVGLEEAQANDPGYEEHLAEIIRRSDEAHAHPELLLDGEQVKQNVRELLKRMRGQ
jgi:hypothetical protein